VRYRILILLAFGLVLCGGVQAQKGTDSIPGPKDSLKNIKHDIPKLVVNAKDTLKKSSKDTTHIKQKPNVSRAVWMGAIIPGYGQIANKKYWKLPLVYGGLAGCGYAIWFNNSSFNKYRSAYADFTDLDPKTNSYLNLLPAGSTVDNFGGNDSFARILKAKQDYYRRYRDMSVMITVIVYAATLVDAYVDAQLFDFDISPNLSMHIQPSIIQSPIANTNVNSFGLQCSLNLWR
jgi:Family of unknown function (DUF5683)